MVKPHLFHIKYAIASHGYKFQMIALYTLRMELTYFRTLENRPIA